MLRRAGWFRPVFISFSLALSGSAFGQQPVEQPVESTDASTDPGEPADSLPPGSQTAALGGEVELPATEWEKRQGADQRLTAYGPDLLGDGIDPATGSIVFEHTDVSLPGNSHLVVALQRRRSQGKRSLANVNNEFGDWALVVPRMQAITYIDDSWAGCGTSYAADFPTYYKPTEPEPTPIESFDYSEGVTLEVPGQSAQQVLEAPVGAQWPVGAVYVTTDNWSLSCTGAGDFIATAPNGDRYRFDHFYSMTAPPLGSMNKPKYYQSFARRNLNIRAATEVTDVNGNWVRYTYDASHRLTRIEANDGRVITLAYANSSYPNLITSATANGRSWTYSYAASDYRYQPHESVSTLLPNQVLTAVTQPDGRSWQFYMPGMMVEPSPGKNCNATPLEIRVTHPYGVLGVFETAERNHRMGNDLSLPEPKAPWGTYRCIVPTPPPCPPPPNDCQTFYDFAQVGTISVTRKTLSGPQIPTAVWTYDYEIDNGPAGTGDGTNWTKIVEPGGAEITYQHVWSADWVKNNKLTRRETRQSAGGALLEAVDYSYLAESAVGATFAVNSYTGRTIPTPIRLDLTTITRGADWYRTDNAYDSNFWSSTYSYGFPTQVDETSSTAFGLTRTTVSAYAHNQISWVLGLPATVTRNGKLFDSFTYDSLGRVSTQSMFGILRQTFTYSTVAGELGAVATFKDSHNHQWTLSNWKRGRPQLVLRPGGLGQISRVIDDNGWVTSETDARGFTTGFAYNPVGWVTLVNLPAPFADILTYYSGYGSILVADSYRGTRRDYVEHDAMLRPTRTLSLSTDGSAGTVYERTVYDIFGRATFKSWPTHAPTAPDGIETIYDALGRVTKTRENVSPYAETNTAYIGGKETRATDPLGYQTTTIARAFGDPNAGEIMSATDPMGTVTATTRDIYGNVTQLTQSGTSPVAASVTRNFWYDGNLRLCRHRAPEFGSDEVFLYDSEGLLTQSGRGEAAASFCPATISTAIRVTRSHDALHRETAVSFPAGTPGVTRAYDANGNLVSAARGSAPGPAWTYAYGPLDNLTAETLAVDGRSYAFAYAYDAQGSLTQRAAPGATFDLDPDARGRPRAARVGTANYISGASYNPNGTVYAANFGNGYILNQPTNARSLPAYLGAYKPGAPTVSWKVFSYDARGKVAAMTDAINAAETRSFAYDGLGRLLSATGPFGAASYLYDALSNLRTRNEGTGGTSTIAYDGANRVSTATVEGSARTYVHDNRGNITSTGPTGFVFDFSNQPTALTGTGAASYQYDANFKRVKEVRSGKTIYTVYSRLTGGLVYRDEASEARTTHYAAVGPAQFRLTKTGTGAFVPTYTHTDHLGTPLAATDAAGAAARNRSQPAIGFSRRPI